MARRTVTVISPLSRAECARRIEEAIDRDAVLFGKRPVIGRVRATSLRLRKRIKSKNSFQTFLFAKIADVAGQTRFDCRFGMHPVVIGFMTFWFGAIVTMGLGAIVEASGVSDMLSVTDPTLVLAPLGMIAFGIALVIVGRYSARDDQKFLTDFLLRAVDGRIQAPGPVSPRGAGLRMLAAPLSFLFLAGAPTDGHTQTDDLAALKTEFTRPVEAPPAPDDNPTTAAKVRLGWALFQDRRLSADRSLACVDCHQPERDWQDGRARALGLDRRPLGRRTATLFDVAWGMSYFRDGRAESLEAQAVVPIEAGDEMNQKMINAVARLRDVAFYQGLFAEAFPGDPHVSERNVARAIAAFERTIVSGTTPFDRWVDGEEGAISPAAKRGFVLFTGSANCATCHTGWRLTDDAFHDTGLPNTDDPGRGAVTGMAALNHAFKTPSLRNVARRPPYMHDGSLPTLRAVVDHYSDGIVGRPTLSTALKRIALSEAERADLIAFLEALTDDREPDLRWSPFR